LAYNLNTNKEKPKPTPMKRIIYTLLFVAFSSFAFSSCTEEDVAPVQETSNGGGGEIDPIHP